MKIFLLYDDDKEKDDLKKIILNNDLGILAGESNNIREITEEIVNLKPDLIILNVSKEDLGGLDLIKDIKKKTTSTHIIIISDPESKKMVEMAYRYGADFFIYKPISDFEVSTIIRKVKDKIILDKQITKIYQMVKNIRRFDEEIYDSTNWEKEINGILLKLGIIGENGSEDIVRVAKYAIENDINLNYMSIRDLCSKFTDNPKAMEQKMRRAINMAMTNIASLGIEDYMNDTFVEYSNTLFNFEQVKKEMDYLRGKSYEKGSINMKRFISGICTICENNNNILRNI
ncbi:MAG: response regulator [Tissierellia bacterium]|nr:response regulator [Tissierellia bacterium]